MHTEAGNGSSTRRRRNRGEGRALTCQARQCCTGPDPLVRVVGILEHKHNIVDTTRKLSPNPPCNSLGRQKRSPRSTTELPPSSLSYSHPPAPFFCLVVLVLTILDLLRPRRISIITHPQLHIAHFPSLAPTHPPAQCRKNSAMLMSPHTQPRKISTSSSTIKCTMPRHS
jgi:hypothetical protein